MTQVSEIGIDLRRLPCLSGLKEEDLASIGEMAVLKTVSRNEVLFEESEPMRSFFIVRNGAVKLYKTSSEGRELIVKIIGRGDYFCCAPIYAGGSYFVSAKAVEDTSLIVIPADQFKEMLCSGLNEIGLRILSGLCSRIRYLSNLVEDLTFKDVEQRATTALLRLAEEKAPEDTIVSLKITHQDIASMSGTVREVVSRIMSRLKKEGVITDSSIRGFKLNKESLSRLIN